MYRSLQPRKLQRPACPWPLGLLAQVRLDAKLLGYSIWQDFFELEKEEAVVLLLSIELAERQAGTAAIEPISW